MSQGRGIVEEHIGFSSQFQNKIGFQSCVNLQNQFLLRHRTAYKLWDMYLNRIFHLPVILTLTSP
jgi:hypothetical protein